MRARERKTLILNILWIPNWWFFSHLHYYQSCNHLAIIFVNWAPIYGPFCWFNCWFLTSQALKLSFQLSLLQDTIRSSFFLNLRSSYTSSLKTKKRKKRNHVFIVHFANYLPFKNQNQGKNTICESILELDKTGLKIRVHILFQLSCLQHLVYIYLPKFILLFLDTSWSWYVLRGTWRVIVNWIMSEKNFAR